MRAPFTSPGVLPVSSSTWVSSGHTAGPQDGRPADLPRLCSTGWARGCFPHCVPEDRGMSLGQGRLGILLICMRLERLLAAVKHQELLLHKERFYFPEPPFLLRIPKGRIHPQSKPDLSPRKFSLVSKPSLAAMKIAGYQVFQDKVLSYMIFQALSAEGAGGDIGGEVPDGAPHGDSGGQRLAGCQRCAGLRGAEGRSRDQERRRRGVVRAHSPWEAQGPHPSFFLQRFPGAAQRSEAEQDHTCRQGAQGSPAGTRDGGRGSAAPRR